jgi:hypothetical protein
MNTSGGSLSPAFSPTLPALHISPRSTPIINQNAKIERERERMQVARGGREERQAGGR